MKLNTILLTAITWGAITSLDAKDDKDTGSRKSYDTRITQAYSGAQKKGALEVKKYNGTLKDLQKEIDKNKKLDTKDKDALQDRIAQLQSALYVLSELKGTLTQDSIKDLAQNYAAHTDNPKNPEFLRALSAEILKTIRSATQIITEQKTNVTLESPNPLDSTFNDATQAYFDIARKVPGASKKDLEKYQGQFDDKVLTKKRKDKNREQYKQWAGEGYLGDVIEKLLSAEPQPEPTPQPASTLAAYEKQLTRALQDAYKDNVLNLEDVRNNLKSFQKNLDKDEKLDKSEKKELGEYVDTIKSALEVLVLGDSAKTISKESVQTLRQRYAPQGKPSFMVHFLDTINGTIDTAYRIVAKADFTTHLDENNPLSDDYRAKTTAYISYAEKIAQATTKDELEEIKKKFEKEFKKSDDIKLYTQWAEKDNYLSTVIAEKIKTIGDKPQPTPQPKAGASAYEELIVDAVKNAIKNDELILKDARKNLDKTQQQLKKAVKDKKLSEDEQKELSSHTEQLYRAFNNLVTSKKQETISKKSIAELAEQYDPQNKPVFVQQLLRTITRDINTAYRIIGKHDFTTLLNKDTPLSTDREKTNAYIAYAQQLAKASTKDELEKLQEKFNKAFKDVKAQYTEWAGADNYLGTLIEQKLKSSPDKPSGNDKNTEKVINKLLTLSSSLRILQNTLK